MIIFYISSNFLLIFGYSCVPALISITHASMRPVAKEANTRTISVTDHDGFSSHVNRHNAETTISFSQPGHLMRKRVPNPHLYESNDKIPMASNIQAFKRRGAL